MEPLPCTSSSHKISAVPDSCRTCPPSKSRNSKPECILHFYDHSRNGSHRWCDVTQCGNRVKVNEHYHRKKAQPSP
ncbi:CGNR zinc finger domain-containing protein [Paenibacillus rubinfantis]|uniref:CGNR zinc finger domain-containing protein n=1 Tax=Paenibacillus rubinfantis TaxID=1720296 RepID=UPI0009E94A28|nr:CGNR zinc finger domain-containing protein [Paenibacillus rubinfantis]